MPRYSVYERTQLNLVREKLSNKLKGSPQFPEVVGDRKLLRFLRGHNYDMEKACSMISKFLDWRKENNVDTIRQNIVSGGCNMPSKFPKADLILKLLPQAVLCPSACDKKGAPISVEKFNFSPSEVMKFVSMTEYIEFLIYCLEYKSLVSEWLSEKADRDYLASLSVEERVLAESEQADVPPYGIIRGLCIIRDLEGLGFEHVGSQGQEILRTVITLSSDNYPELLSKCYIINSGFIFNTIWFFASSMMSARTLAKIANLGSIFMPELQKDIDNEFIPSIIGGPYSVDAANEVPFEFDLEYFGSNSSQELTSAQPEADTKESVKTVSVSASSVMIEKSENGTNFTSLSTSSFSEQVEYTKTEES